jgi:lipopolysaccharide export system ATP-binding protein
MTPVPHLLRAQGLAKSYKGRQVVHDTTLEVKSGEIVGLLGPNGAGKTTSFYMIIGLVKADAGQVWLDTHELSHAGMARRAKQGIGYLPQEASIFR